jgi:hypothetical protein
MQNLPKEMIFEVVKYLDPKDVVRLSATCKEYKDILDKLVKLYKRIDEIQNNRCFEVNIVIDPTTSYIYHVYTRKSKYARVVVRKCMYIDGIYENVGLYESREMSFDMFLYYACKSYLELFEHANSQFEDKIFDINKMRSRVNKLIETYIKRGALDTILLFKKYTDRMDFGITITNLFILPDF